ncbi:MAG TPA: hybrid sensor histidine kinase/response regulator [Burkholderiaceae bacterium]|nr:hybrid sensor histidine kinase/response regulator [Burkholderiaceae bacterium]
MGILPFRPSPARLSGTMSPEDKVRMIAALDHDARTPQQILSFSHKRMGILVGQMLDPNLDGEALRELVRKLQQEVATASTVGRRLTDLQQDLVDALRLDFDDTQAQPRTISADELIHRARKGNEHLAATYGVEIRGVASRLKFVADERWVERVLNNLIVNAVAHSHGTKVLIGARQRDGDILFEVRDNGRGMKPEAVARVFEPLAPPSLPGIGHSLARSGLGLYVVRLYVERMGGAVDCHSAQGAGTRFEVRLPGPVTRGEKRRKRDDAAILEAVRNKVVAIIDDDAEMLRTVERMFETLGVTVLPAEEPVAFFVALGDATRRPDLFLMDFQLKGQDIVNCLSMVRRRWENPPIIILTGHHNQQALLQISKTVPVMRKPLNEARFDQVLEVLAGQADLPEAGFL